MLLNMPLLFAQEIEVEFWISLVKTVGIGGGVAIFACYMSMRMFRWLGETLFSKDEKDPGLITKIAYHVADLITSVKQTNASMGKTLSDHVKIAEESGRTLKQLTTNQSELTHTATRIAQNNEKMIETLDADVRQTIQGGARSVSSHSLTHDILYRVATMVHLIHANPNANIDSKMDEIKEMMELEKARRIHQQAG